MHTFYTHGPMPNPPMQYKGAGPRIVSVGGILPKFPRFVSVVGSNVFVQQLNFPRPSFPHHCNKRPLGTLHMVPCRCWAYHDRHLCITYLPLYNRLFSTLDLFAMMIHVASNTFKIHCCQQYWLNLKKMMMPPSQRMKKKNPPIIVNDIYKQF